MSNPLNINGNNAEYSELSQSPYQTVDNHSSHSSTAQSPAVGKFSDFAVNSSWAVNWFLLGAKLYCTIVSSSKAVTAALADSVVDLVSQGVLSLADSYISKHSPDYPVGRSRLEALSVIACAFIMSMAAVEGEGHTRLVELLLVAVVVAYCQSLCTPPHSQ